MNNIRHALVAAITLCIVATPVMAVDIGQPAPGFTLADHTGKTVRLSDFAGKIVVLEWFNPDCPFIKRHHEERPTMNDVSARYAEKDVVWLAVNSTKYMDRQANASWHKKWNMPFAILVDRDGTVGRAYDAKTTPHMIIIDKQGKVAYNGAIDSDRPGDDDNPVNYVDSALAQLVAGQSVSKPQTKPYGCSVKYAPKTFHDHTVKDIDGKPVTLADYKGRVALVVNVASKCGRTRQYKPLQEVYTKYKDKGLVVLGFSANYGVTFPMFSKISVAGEDQDPLYGFLTASTANPDFAGKITWNFNKFLIDHNGTIIARFDKAEPDSPEVIKAIELALNERASVTQSAAR